MKGKLAKNLSKIKDYYDNLKQIVEKGINMQNRLALVTDFDGTVSDDDFFDLVAKKYLVPEALVPWDLYLEGKLSHLEALSKVFAQIKIPEKELNNFIKKIHIDKSFSSVAEYCFKQKIPIYMCSAGCDYYIKISLGNIIDKYDIHLITNHGEYNSQTGLKMIPPKNSPFYDQDVGISKAGVVSHLQKQGYKVVLCGDGPPDFAPAQIADVVFAKKFLLKKCIEAKINTQPFHSFKDVLNYLEGGHNGILSL